jgi:hypothetical protein
MSLREPLNCIDQQDVTDYRGGGHCIESHVLGYRKASEAPHHLQTTLGNGDQLSVWSIAAASPVPSNMSNRAVFGCW